MDNKYVANYNNVDEAGVYFGGKRNTAASQIRLVSPAGIFIIINTITSGQQSERLSRKTTACLTR